jgi:hypothetical protein
MKRRCEYDDIYAALEDTQGQGGWFFVQETGKAFWFSHEHTLTEVFATPGNGRIGTADYIRQELYPEEL